MNNKGFFAISIIYSFFIVFLALMLAILAQSINSRILVSKVKGEIRDELIDTRSLFVGDLPSGFEVGDVIYFAGEKWMVLKDNSTNYVLILDRALTRTELIRSLGLTLQNNAEIEYDYTHYYGTCVEEDKCQVRACKSYYGDTCFYLNNNDGFYRKPTWKTDLTDNQRIGQQFGTTIVSKAVNTWFDSHQGLQRIKNAQKLVGKTNPPKINDGTSLGSSNQVSGFVRLPYSSEVENLPILVNKKLKETAPFHLVDVDGNYKVKVFTNEGTISSVQSNSPALVRPVVEVLKSTG